MEEQGLLLEEQQSTEGSTEVVEQSSANTQEAAPERGDGPVQDGQQGQSCAIAHTEMAEAPENLEEGPPEEVQTPEEEIQTEAKVCAPCLVLMQKIQSTVHTYLAFLVGRD